MRIEAWRRVAERAIAAIGAREGEVVQVRDRSGRQDVVESFLIELERVGATPLYQPLHASYLEALIRETSKVHLANWDLRRSQWHYDRVISLQSPPAITMLPAGASADAWRAAVGRLSRHEDELRIPSLVVAVPTPEFDHELMEGLQVSSEDLEKTAQPFLRHMVEKEELLLTSKIGTFQLHLDGAIVHKDFGLKTHFSEQAPVSNLPAGAVYFVPAPGTGTGDLPVNGQVWSFSNGALETVDGSHPSTQLHELEGCDAGGLRISHLGVGCNPHLRRRMDWPLVDEHRFGELFICLGDNVYLGGSNSSTFNQDWTLLDVKIYDQFDAN